MADKEDKSDFGYDKEVLHHTRCKNNIDALQDDGTTNLSQN